MKRKIWDEKRKAVLMNSDNKNLTGKMILTKLKISLPLHPALRACACAAASAAVSGAPFFGIAYPFGLALISAAKDALTAASMALGAIIGMLWTPDFIANAVAILVLLIGRAVVSLLLSPDEADKDPSGAAAPVPVKRRGSLLQMVLRFDFSRAGASRLALAGVSAILSGALSLALRRGYTVSSLIGVFFCAAVTPLFTYAFIAVLEKRPGSLYRVGLLILLFAAARSLHTCALFLFDPAILFAFAAPIVITYREVKGGSPSLSATAVTAGIVLGMAIDAGGAPMYGAAAIAAGLCMPFSATAAVTAGWAAAIAVSFAEGGIAALASYMPEITCATAVLLPLLHYSLIPCREVSRGEELTRAAAAEASRVQEAKAEEAITRVQSISEACGNLSGVFDAVSQRLRRPSVAQLKAITDAAADARCATCENRVLCWEREYASTADTVCRITAALHRDGRVSAAVIPKHLAARCHYMDGILDEVNEKCAIRTAEAARTDRTDVLSEDLSSFSEILADTAAGVKEQFRKDEALSRRLTRALATSDFSAESITVYGGRKRHIVARAVNLSATRMGNDEIRGRFEEICGARLTAPEYEIDGSCVTMTMESRAKIRTEYGSATRAAGEDTSARRVPNGDTATELTTPDGRFISIISDGMGTGGEAAVTSRLSVTFLSKMLSAGVSLKNALTMLNNYLRARNMECSAGIDVMELDLYEGEARFVKSGAAPSFVIREGRLFRLSSKTVPIGILRALDAEMIRFTVQAGDTVVMLSDGVMSGFEEAAWLCDLLASPHVISRSPEQIAEKIVAAAATESRDDITAAVIKLR